MLMGFFVSKDMSLTSWMYSQWADYLEIELLVQELDDRNLDEIVFDIASDEDEWWNTTDDECLPTVYSRSSPDLTRTCDRSFMFDGLWSKLQTAYLTPILNQRIYPWSILEWEIDVHESLSFPHMTLFAYTLDEDIVTNIHAELTLDNDRWGMKVKEITWDWMTTYFSHTIPALGQNQVWIWLNDQSQIVFSIGEEILDSWFHSNKELFFWLKTKSGWVGLHEIQSYDLE